MSYLSVNMNKKQIVDILFGLTVNRYTQALLLTALFGCATNSPAVKETVTDVSSPHADSPPIIHSRSDMEFHKDQLVIVEGTYQAIPIPRKGTEPAENERPKECAQIVLRDGTSVYLEAYNAEAFKRPEEELIRYDGKSVRVQGLLYLVMPSAGQSLAAPSVSYARILDDSSLDFESIIRGSARNAKAGAVVSMKSGEVIYVQGLEKWPLELLGKNVEVMGILQRKGIFPEVRMDSDGSISQGMEGIPLVIEPKSSHVVP
jgi:hypothetical protein